MIFSKEAIDYYLATGCSQKELAEKFGFSEVTAGTCQTYALKYYKRFKIK